MSAQISCRNCNAPQRSDALRCDQCGESLGVKELEGGRYIGQMISQRYRVVERLARGGMGEVYVAEHVEMQQLVAVKFLHRRYAHEESFATRFFNEARYAAQMTHPNAVALYDFGRLPDGTLFIVMEYVRGESLSRVVRTQGMIPVPMAIRVSTQIAEVLASAHEKKIIHRDVKPDNIMLVQGAGGRVSVKVLDFGIAKILDDDDGNHTEPGVMFGTPEYMSPEQALGRPYDHRVDIYALGLVMYYMLAGAPPFSGTNKIAVLQAQVQQQAPPLDRTARQPIPRRLAQLIARCLEKDPARRFLTMVDVLQELDALQTTLDENAAPAPVPVDEVVEPRTSQLSPAFTSGAQAPVAQGVHGSSPSRDYRLVARPVERLVASDSPEAWASSLPAELGARVADEVIELESLVENEPNADVGVAGRTGGVESASPLPTQASATARKADDTWRVSASSDREERSPVVPAAAPAYHFETGPVPVSREPWSMQTTTTTGTRMLRKESGTLIAVAVLAAALVVVVTTVIVMRKPVEDTIVLASGEVVHPSSELTDAQRDAFALSEVRQFLSAGDVNAARSRFEGISANSSESASYLMVRDSLENAESLVAALTSAVDERRCADAHDARATLAREISLAASARYEAQVSSCAPTGSQAANTTARPSAASRPSAPTAAVGSPTPPPAPARPAAAAPTPAAPRPAVTPPPARPAATASRPAPVPAVTRPPTRPTPAAAPTPTPTPAAPPASTPASSPASSPAPAPLRLPDADPAPASPRPPAVVLPDEL